MDKIESLTSTLQNITLYDIKSMYNQVQLGSCPPNYRPADGVVLGEECRPECQ